ncbi:hypothetical protein [Flammeovirga sp. SJP92]|uniref:hypothetical protein n=1 Tax=Flammeovirga sp. SJP92 TaxID=1775430 RepID=UPI000788FB28|nr:hypothetical protein [Flammeovirga sp. SJP92]KXX68841.1 hypothetical protein AVL50_18580 [Flammeovirga sp. SJP92]
MIKYLILPFLLVYTLQVQAQQTNYSFEGLINTELKVRLRFSVEDKKAEGYCIYMDTKDKKTLTGEFTEDGTLTLRQSDGERFEGKVIANYMYKGEFFNKENVDQGTFLFSKIETPIAEDEAILSNATPKTTNSETTATKKSLTETEISDILDRYIKEYKECYQKGIDPMKCRQYTSRAITEIFNVDDFKDPYVGGSFLTMTEAYDKIAADSNWKMLGEASDKGTLAQAIEKANNDELVVVAYAFKGFIQLSFIRKGEGKMSSKWGTKVPEVAIFFNNDPNKSYSSKGLNYLWRDASNIEIWIKK